MEVNTTIILILITLIFSTIILIFFRFVSQEQRYLMSKLANDLNMNFLPKESHPLFARKGYIEGIYRGRLVKIQVYHLGWSVDHWGDERQTAKKGRFFMECANIDQSKIKRTDSIGTTFDDIGKSSFNSNAFTNKSLEIIESKLNEKGLYFHVELSDWNPEWHPRNIIQVLELLREKVTKIELDISSLQMKLFE